MSEKTHPKDVVVRSHKSKQSHLVSELMILRDDLKNSMACFVQWRGLLKTLESLDKDDPKYFSIQIIAKSLFRDGVVTFIGCFDTSVDNSLNEEKLYEGVDGATQFMKYLHDIRNMWIAHRHGPLRQSEWGVIINPDTGEIEHEAEVSSQYNYPEGSAIDGILRLIKIAEAHTAAHLEEQLDILRDVIEDMHPNARKKLKPIQIIQMDNPNMFNIGRQRFKKSYSQSRNNTTPNE